MQQGWIQLHRQIQSSDIWNDEEPFDRRSAWIDLLLSANHKERKIVFDGKATTIKRGQLITSVRTLSDKWNWSVNRTYRYLKLLEDLEMINRESDSRRTLITIVKYDFFQSYENTDEYSHGYSHEYSNRTLTDTVLEQSRIQSRNTNNNVNNYNNDKKDKNEKNVKKEIFGEYRNVKLTHEEYERLGTDYGEDMRKDLITFLDAYIEEKGYQSKSHNLAIRRWVVDAVKRQKPKQNPESDFFAALDACV